MVIDNNMTLGMFMAFNAYRGQFSQRASSLIDLIMQLRMLSLHNERLSEIVFSEPEKNCLHDAFLQKTRALNWK